MADSRGGQGGDCSAGGNAGLGNSNTSDPTAAFTGSGGRSGDAVQKEQVTRVPLSRNVGQRPGQLHHEDKNDKGAECWPDPTGGYYCFDAPRH